MGNDFGHQADLLGTRGVDHLTGHRQPPGHPGTDQPRQPCRHPAAGQDADPAWVSANTALRAIRKSHASAISSPPVKVAPFTAPITGAQRHNGIHAIHLVEPAEVIHAELLCLLQVDPGAERRVGAGEHHRPDRVVRVGRPQGRRTAPRTVSVLNAFRTSGRFIVRTDRAVVLAGAGSSGQEPRRVVGQVQQRLRQRPSAKVIAAVSVIMATLSELGVMTSGASSGGSVKNISTITRT